MPDARKRGTVIVLKGKTSAARRFIPVTARVLSVLATRWQSQGSPTSGWVWPAPTKTGHISHSTLKKQHRMALKVAKLEPFVLYSLRHTFLTRLGASGCDVWTLMRIAGHSSIAISSRYVHPHPDTIDRAFAALGTGVQQSVATPGRHKNGHNGKSGVLQPERKIAQKRREYRGLLVSAAGFEPATHALKGHCSTN